MNRFEAVRELVKNPSLRVTDIAKQTGYNKGHVSRLRKEATKKEWVGLTDEEIQKVVSKKWWDWEDLFDIEGFSRAIEAKLKEKNGL